MTQPDPGLFTATPPAPAPEHRAVPVEDRQLIPAPQVYIDGEWVTLFGWMRQTSHGSEGALVKNIVRDFYTACLTDPLIRGYFPGEGSSAMTFLRQHFSAALVTLAKDGLWLSTANALAAAHAHVQNRDTGDMITDEAYNAVIGHLVAVLTSIRYGVPNTPECLGRLAAMTEAARPLIVHASTRTTA